jgi:glycosyltransferase involved in cell wall biosynthesis
VLFWLDISIVIPLWNEEKNVDALIMMLSQCKMFNHDNQSEAILVNNGSTDNTGSLIEKHTANFRWLKAVHLKQNLNYGGGIYEGCRNAKNEYIMFIPGDLQYLSDDIDKIALSLHDNIQKLKTKKILAKGNRTKRSDSNSFQKVSSTYTLLVNSILGLKVKDVNGLPKAFHRNLLDLLPANRMITFVFDAQLLFIARNNKWEIIEEGVTFHARRAGVSSWSGKRFKVYIRSILQLIKVRFSRNDPGEKMTSKRKNHS